MKCDKCIHKPVCFVIKNNTIDNLERMEQCCCYVEVDDPDEFVIKGDVEDIRQHPVIRAIKYVHVKYIPKTRIKAIPIKSRTLCEKCLHGEYCQNHPCDECAMLRRTDSDKLWFCGCTQYEDGKPCRSFKRKENTLPTKMTPGFFVDRCKCGGNIYVQFGFSCTCKPMTTLRCDNCFKSVSVIGNIERGKKFMDIWEGADNG